MNHGIRHIVNRQAHQAKSVSIYNQDLELQDIAVITLSHCI